MGEMHGSLITYETFMALLGNLDEKLVERGVGEVFDIKAIGGFAMIAHAKEMGIADSRNASRDIDTLNEIGSTVQTCIEEVAEECNVNSDWLNNEWFTIKKGKEEFEYFAQWRILDEGFEKISLRILDIETMFFFKMRAINERLEHGVGLEGSTPRPQDVEDVGLIMNWMDEEDLRNLKNAKMASCVAYFPLAVEWIEEQRQ